MNQEQQEPKESNTQKQNDDSRSPGVDRGSPGVDRNLHSEKTKKNDTEESKKD